MIRAIHVSILAMRMSIRPGCPRYWESRIVPELRANKTVLIVAHGNSLRALVKMLDMMSESDIVEFNIPTGIPMLYELDEQLQPVSRRFLGDPGAVAAAQDAVRRQTEKK